MLVPKMYEVKITVEIKNQIEKFLRVNRGK